MRVNARSLASGGLVADAILSGPLAASKACSGSRRCSAQTLSRVFPRRVHGLRAAARLGLLAFLASAFGMPPCRVRRCRSTNSKWLRTRMERPWRTGARVSRCERRSSGSVIRRSGGQTDAAAAAAAAGKTRTRFFFVGDEPIAGRGRLRQAEADNRLIDASERAWHALYADFLSRLQSGELIASGYRVPVDPEIGRQDIPTDLWTVLRPNVRNSSASGGGCQFVAILVSRRPASAPFEALPVSRDATERRAPSFPGRPSIMQALIAHMRERAERQELASTLSAEARELEHWARLTFPGQQVPKANSIRNGVREEYRKLAAGKSA